MIKRINNADLFSQPSLTIFTKGTNNSDHVYMWKVGKGWNQLWGFWANLQFGEVVVRDGKSGSVWDP